MVRMAGNLLAWPIFIWLVVSCNAILPQSYSKENTSRRNSLLNTLPNKSEVLPVMSDVPPTYECLYVSPDLPACDIERMEDSAEDITHSTADSRRETKALAENFGKDQRSAKLPARIRRNVLAEMKATPQGSPGRHIIVYTIEGCLPPSLPFKMPSCQQKSSLDKILEVRKLYPFTVKGLTRPPLIFPEFSIDRWTRMMKRLRSHPSSTSAEKSRLFSRNTSLAAKENGQSRMDSLTVAAASMKPLMPNRTASSAKLLKSSLAKESGIHEPKTPKLNERKIKADESLLPIKNKKLATKEKHTEKSSKSLQSENIGADDLRSNTSHLRSEMFNKKNTNEQVYKTEGTKSPHSSNGFRVLQKSWSSPRKKNPSFMEERLANHRNTDVIWSGMTKIPTFKTRGWAPHTVIGSKQNLYSDPINFHDLSNDLSVHSNPNKSPSFPRILSSNKYNDLDTEPRQSVLDMNEFLTESSRKRREIRVPDEISHQTITNDAKEHESTGKSSSHQHRQNSLNTLDKSDRIFDLKNRDDNLKPARESVDSFASGRTSDAETTENYPRQLDSYDSNTEVSKTKESLQKGHFENQSMRKKYSDTIGITLKHNKRIRRE